MATKIITLDPRFSTGEPTVQLVVTPGRGGRSLREKTSLHMSKTASQSPAMDYIRCIEPQPGKTIVLVIGLGDCETYGANRNGDGFPSEPVPGKISADEVLTKHYKTYENAHVYEHHVNHDPAKAIGKVIKAFWNPFMRRVEVLEDFDHEKAPHLLERVGSGEFPSKSMGTRIPFDVCDVCGNRAPTRKQYCDHLRFEMNRIYPDGKQARALNPSPRFFDSSWVVRPADRTGFMLKKVAYDSPYEIRLASYELSERVEDLRDKSAALGKAADMEKVVTGVPDAVSTGTDQGSLKLLKNYSDKVAPGEAKKLPSSDVRITIEYTPDEAVGTTDALGIPMGLRDLIKYFMGRMGAPGAPTDDELDCACKHAGALLELFSEYPRAYDDALKMAGLADLDLHGRVNTKLANHLWPAETMVDDKPLIDTALHRRRLPLPMPFKSESPNTDVLTFTDPSGRTHRTNVGEARRTTDALRGQAQVGKAARGAGYLGLGTVLGTAGLGAIATGGRSPLRRLGGAALLGGGLVSAGKGVHEVARPVRVSDLAGPKIMTNEGHVIPAYTQMKSGAWQPDMLYAVLRKRDGEAACAPLDMRRKIAVHTAARSAEVHDELSSLLGPTLQLEKIALLIEQSISTLA